MTTDDLPYIVQDAIDARAEVLMQNHAWIENLIRTEAHKFARVIAASGTSLQMVVEGYAQRQALAEWKRDMEAA